LGGWVQGSGFRGWEVGLGVEGLGSNTNLSARITPRLRSWGVGLRYQGYGGWVEG